MTKRGSALMQVLVVGLIVAAFAVLMLRYAITRSANLSRTERILESEIIADSCLDQYMAYWAQAELSGRDPCNLENFECLYYASMTATSPSVILMNATQGDKESNRNVYVTEFTVPIQ